MAGQDVEFLMLDVAPHLRDTLTRGFRAGVKPRHENGAGPDAGTGQGVKVRMCERSLIRN